MPLEKMYPLRQHDSSWTVIRAHHTALTFLFLFLNLHRDLSLMPLSRVVSHKLTDWPRHKLTLSHQPITSDFRSQLPEVIERVTNHTSPLQR